MGSRASPPSRKGEARLQSIVAEARSALLSSGYARLSLRDVAKRIGISIGNLQYYFPTKDDLVAAIIQEEVDESLGLLTDIDWTPDRLEESVQLAVSRLMRRLAGPPGQLYLVSGFLALTEPRFQRLQTSGYGQVFRSIGDAIALLAPDLSTDARRATTRIVVALFDGAVLQLQAMGEGTSEGPNDATPTNTKTIETASPRTMPEDDLTRFIDTVSTVIAKLIRSP